MVIASVLIRHSSMTLTNYKVWNSRSRTRGRSGQAKALQDFAMPFIPTSLISVRYVQYIFRKVGFSVLGQSGEPLRNHLLFHPARRWQVILDIADRSPSRIPPEIRQAPQILHSQQ
mgnify:CR=1 FL=1